MAAPVITLTSPADLDVGTPIGTILEVRFDKGIDLNTAKDHVVLYGADTDITSGPDSAIWIDKETANNPYFLRSPGFKGLVELQYEVAYYDLTSGVEDTSPPVLVSEAAELSNNLGMILKCTPREALGPDTEFTWHILGDPSALGAGISSRTVFDVVADVGNASVTGDILAYGGYTGTTSDEVVVEITTSGDIGTAKYRWYYLSAGVDTAIQGRIPSRRRRRTADGVQIRFTGSGFVAGDFYRFTVEPPTRLATNTKVTFTTNDGSYTAPPLSPSTPAPSSPPANVLPPAPGASTSTALSVLNMVPRPHSYNNSLHTRTFTITFSDDIDPATITNASVRIYKYPVSGRYDGQPEVKELQKVLTVVDDILTIEI